MTDTKRLMELAYGKPPANDNEVELLEIAALVDPVVWRLKHYWRRVDTLKAAVRIVDRNRSMPVFDFAVTVAPKKTFFSRFRRAA